MKILRTNLSGKLLIAALATLLVFPAFAQRHAMNDYFADTSHHSKNGTKRDITFGFFSPINQHISFTYEQPLNYQMVLSARLGIIGPGFNIGNGGYSYNYSNAPKPLGAYVGCGVKLFIHPDFIMEGMRRYNSMQGVYLMPEFIIGNFNYTTTYSYSTGYPYYQNITGTNTENITNYALILNLGRQWVFAEHFIMGLHAGIGYGGYSVKGGTPQQYPYNYNDYNGANFYDYLASGIIVWSAGIDIGVIF
ncbi:MAG TPA: hypothetical protein VNZ45_12550 [Bacteroidia bacterium]|jgi:hypothetical protein|nr:hypothetical protein [Bacteroidia bacterium]